MRVLAIAASTLAFAAVPAAAQTTGDDAAAAHAVARAMKAVGDQRRRCAVREVKPRATHAPPRQSVLAFFGVLRRPATPDDALPFKLAIGAANIDYIRRARVLADSTAV